MGMLVRIKANYGLYRNMQVEVCHLLYRRWMKNMIPIWWLPTQVPLLLVIFEKSKWMGGIMQRRMLYLHGTLALLVLHSRKQQTSRKHVYPLTPLKVQYYKFTRTISITFWRTFLLAHDTPTPHTQSHTHTIYTHTLSLHSRTHNNH